LIFIKEGVKMLMFIKLVFLNLIIFSFGSISLVNDNEVLNRIKEKISYQNDEFIFLNFMNIGDCSKCLNLTFSAYDCVSKRFKELDLPFSPKFIVVVGCNREMEINRFKKIYNWDGLCFFNPGNVKEKLNLPPDTWLAVFKNDTCLINFSLEAKITCDTLFNVLKNYISNR